MTIRKQLEAKRKELENRYLPVDRLRSIYFEYDTSMDNEDITLLMLDEDCNIISEMLNKMEDIIDFLKSKKQFNFTDKQLQSLLKKHKLIGDYNFQIKK